MNSTSLLKALSILFALIFLIMGVVYATHLSTPSANFSTSYFGYPDPKPKPNGEPKDMVEVPGFIKSFDISPDGKLIAIATSQELILYNLKTLDKIHSLFSFLDGGRRDVKKMPCPNHVERGGDRAVLYSPAFPRTGSASAHIHNTRGTSLNMPHSG
jgi:hypothetical protein